MRRYSTTLRTVLFALLPFLLGSATVLAFAPWHLWIIAPATLACLFVMWWKAGSAWRAGIDGTLFGLGLYVAGTSWIHEGFARFLPDQSPVIRILLVLVLQGASALFIGAAGLISAFGARESPLRFFILAPAAWTLSEWARGDLFLGGFTWLAFGYSQVPNGLASSWIPILGVYGGSLIVALAAAALAALALAVAARNASLRRRFSAKGAICGCLVLGLIVVASKALSRFEPTAAFGAPIEVALVQQAFSPDAPGEATRAAELDANIEHILASTQASLVVFPEGASRWYLDHLPNSLALIKRLVATSGRAVLLPSPARGINDLPRNAATLFTGEGRQRYDKIHLVPAGEALPGWMEMLPRAGWKVQLWEAGERGVLPLIWGDQRLAIMICFEDAFGADLRERLADATMLVSVSNLGWFNDVARAQHMQLSQARALETGRPLLRAGQGGITSIIDHRGRVVGVAPNNANNVVEGQIIGRVGATPYVRWGDRPLVLGTLLVVLGLVAAGRVGSRTDSSSLRVSPTRMGVEPDPGPPRA